MNPVPGRIELVGVLLFEEHQCLIFKISMLTTSKDGPFVPPFGVKTVGKKGDASWRMIPH